MQHITQKPIPKRTSSSYQVLVTNEDTFEEVVKFRINKFIVYAALCVMFLFSIILTASLIVFTPLKYYLPGVGLGDAKQVKELRSLKMKADSLEKLQIQNQAYLNNIQKVLAGDVVTKDTTHIAENFSPEETNSSNKQKRKKKK